jgi:hypothetical protein
MLPIQDKLVIEYKVKAFLLDTCTDMAFVQYTLHIEKDLRDKRNFEKSAHRIV